MLGKIENEEQAMMILNGLSHVGPITVRRLMDHFDDDIFAVFKASERELIRVQGVGKKAAETILDWEEKFKLDRELKLLDRHGANYITFRSPDYPELLKNIYDPPLGFYRLGNLTIDGPAVAFVGTRNPTLYGRRVAGQMAEDLARMGFVIVSGMARGIDTEAHNGALRAGGKTMAVLGCGIDIIYPPENIDLYRSISQSGAVISEFPFGRRADRQTFPMRNRVVSGMCDAVVVVESGEFGGSMITARFAGEQGRTVFAVPGRIDQPTSKGCHQLIRDGAILLTSVDELLQEIQYLQGEFRFNDDAGSEANSHSAPELPGNLSQDEREVGKLFLDGSRLNLDQVARHLERNPQECMSLLMMLELKRVIRKSVDGSYELR